MAILKIRDDDGNVSEVPALRGEPGISPHIGENGNWFVGDTDTGIAAGGSGGGGIVLHCKFHSENRAFTEPPVFDFEEVATAFQNGEHIVLIAQDVYDESDAGNCKTYYITPKEMSNTDIEFLSLTYTSNTIFVNARVTLHSDGSSTFSHK